MRPAELKLHLSNHRQTSFECVRKHACRLWGSVPLSKETTDGEFRGLRFRVQGLKETTGVHRASKKASIRHIDLLKGSYNDNYPPQNVPEDVGVPQATVPTAPVLSRFRGWGFKKTLIESIRVVL